MKAVNPIPRLGRPLKSEVSVDEGLVRLGALCGPLAAASLLNNIRIVREEERWRERGKG